MTKKYRTAKNICAAMNKAAELAQANQKALLPFLLEGERLAPERRQQIVGIVSTNTEAQLRVLEFVGVQTSPLYQEPVRLK